MSPGCQVSAAARSSGRRLGAVEHPGQLGDVRRGEHRAAGLPALAVGGDDAGRAAVAHAAPARPAGRRAPGRRWTRSRRTSASGSAPEPPIGVAQPNDDRPAVIENGRMPVPARRTSVIVAKDSQVSRSRACSEANRSAITSCALRDRSASYAASAVEAAGSSRPAFHRACAAARPPSQSASSRR